MQEITQVDWLAFPQLLDIVVTMVLGIMGVWAREIYAHYDKEHPITTSPIRFLLMVIPGMFSGILGGEVSSMANQEAYTWVFALVIGYGGAPVLEILTRAIVDIMMKVLNAFGVSPRKTEEVSLSETPIEKVSQETVPPEPIG